MKAIFIIMYVQYYNELYDTHRNKLFKNICIYTFEENVCYKKC